MKEKTQIAIRLMQRNCKRIFIDDFADNRNKVLLADKQHLTIINYTKIAYR